MSTKTKPEKDFQEVADDYAHRSIESLRDMIEALEHAQECDGTDENEGPCQRGQETESGTLKDGKPYTQMLYENPEAWHDEDQARQRIQEDPLSVEVRSGWHTPGDEDGNKPTEYNILLGTGGPAARIIGELSQHGEPSTAEFQFQDWFKPWTTARTTSEENEIMLKYAQQFYFEV